MVKKFDWAKAQIWRRTYDRFTYLITLIKRANFRNVLNNFFKTYSDIVTQSLLLLKMLFNYMPVYDQECTILFLKDDINNKVSVKYLPRRFTFSIINTRYVSLLLNFNINLIAPLDMYFHCHFQITKNQNSFLHARL